MIEENIGGICHGLIEILPQNFHRGTEENHKALSLGPRFETGLFRIRITDANFHLERQEVGDIDNQEDGAAVLGCELQEIDFGKEN